MRFRAEFNRSKWGANSHNENRGAWQSNISSKHFVEISRRNISSIDLVERSCRKISSSILPWTHHSVFVLRSPLSRPSTWNFVRGGALFYQPRDTCVRYICRNDMLCKIRTIQIPPRQNMCARAPVNKSQYHAGHTKPGIQVSLPFYGTTYRHRSARYSRGKKLARPTIVRAQTSSGSVRKNADLTFFYSF